MLERENDDLEKSQGREREKERAKRVRERERQRQEIDIDIQSTEEREVVAGEKCFFREIKRFEIQRVGEKNIESESRKKDTTPRECDINVKREREIERQREREGDRAGEKMLLRENGI